MISKGSARILLPVIGDANDGERDRKAGSLLAIKRSPDVDSFLIDRSFLYHLAIPPNFLHRYDANFRSHEWVYFDNLEYMR